MRIDARKKKWAGITILLNAVDADTGKDVPHVVWADVGRGEYGQHRTDENGKIMINEAGDALILDEKKGNIELRCR